MKYRLELTIDFVEGPVVLLALGLLEIIESLVDSISSMQEHNRSYVKSMFNKDYFFLQRHIDKDWSPIIFSDEKSSSLTFPGSCIEFLTADRDQHHLLLRSNFVWRCLVLSSTTVILI